MIETVHNNYHRIQPPGEILSPPLTLLKEIDFGNPMRLVYQPVIYDGKLYINTPENKLTVCCLRESDYSMVWEGPERVRNSAVRLTQGFFHHDSSLGFGSDQILNVVLDAENGELLEAHKEIPSLWRSAKNHDQLFANEDRDDIESYKIVSYTLDLKERLWEVDVTDNRVIHELSATDDYLVACDHGSGRECYDAKSGKLLWRHDPYTLGLFKQQSDFWDLGSGGDIVEHGVLKRLRFSLRYPIIHNETVVMSMSGNYMVGVDASSGKVVRKKYLEYSNNLGYVAYGDYLYTQGGAYIEIHRLDDGMLHERIEIDVDSYQKLSGTNGRPVMSRFTVSETHVFGVQRLEGNFFSVDKRTGKVDWLFHMNREIYSPDVPCIHNGRIYFRSRGSLYIFEGVDGFLGD